jgi:hypothetical protein
MVTNDRSDRLSRHRVCDRGSDREHAVQRERLETRRWRNRKRIHNGGKADGAYCARTGVIGVIVLRQPVREAVTITRISG